MIYLLFSFLVFTIYILFVVRKYGALKSVSDSYYKIKHKALFTLVLWFFALPVAVVSNSPIMFFAVAGICLVGAAPAFKDQIMEMKVHVIGATSGIVLALVSLWLEHGLWYLTVGYIITYFTLFLIKIKHFTWWIEVMAFYLVLIGLLIKLL